MTASSARIGAVLLGVSLIVAGCTHLEPQSAAAAGQVVAPATTALSAPTTPAPATSLPAPTAPPPTGAPTAGSPIAPIVGADGIIRTVTPTLDGAPTVALTFDDGPDPKWTPQVLAALKAAGIHATFCMVGLWVVRYPQLVRAVVADGHVLCDHTINHDERLPHRSAAIIDAQLRVCADDIERVAGTRPRFYRAPGGQLSPAIIDTAHRLGMQVLGWSDDPKDWRHPPAAAITNYVIANLRPGAVVLMHDAGGDRSSTVAQLPALISRIKAMGYRFVTPVVTA